MTHPRIQGPLLSPRAIEQSPELAERRVPREETVGLIHQLQHAPQRLFDLSEVLQFAALDVARPTRDPRKKHEKAVVQLVKPGLRQADPVDGEVFLAGELDEIQGAVGREDLVLATDCLVKHVARSESPAAPIPVSA